MQQGVPRCSHSLSCGTVHLTYISRIDHRFIVTHPAVVNLHANLELKEASSILISTIYACTYIVFAQTTDTAMAPRMQYYW